MTQPPAIEAAASGPFVSDPAGSQARRDALQAYLSAQVYNSEDGFICMSAGMCRTSALKRPGTAFYEAQGSSVGPHYELTDGGRPLRVLIVPMETGRARVGVSVAERTQEVMRAVDLPFRRRNPHMRGVTLALRLAFGLPLDEDAEGEFLTIQDGERVHVLEAYAMANLLLCSAVGEGTTGSRATSLMRSSCARHMRATVKRLEPTLVISQGATLPETLRATLGVERMHSENLAECELAGHRFIWASLHHPTRHWDSLSRPYLTAVVEPTMKEARRLALRY